MAPNFLTRFFPRRNYRLKKTFSGWECRIHHPGNRILEGQPAAGENWGIFIGVWKMKWGWKMNWKSSGIYCWDMGCWRNESWNVSFRNWSLGNWRLGWFRNLFLEIRGCMDFRIVFEMSMNWGCEMWFGIWKKFLWINSSSVIIIIFYDCLIEFFKWWNRSNIFWLYNIYQMLKNWFFLVFFSFHQ